MSRCSICDYSQSADSIYNDGIAVAHHPNNRVIYSPALGKDICLVCYDEYTKQGTFWESMTGDEDVFEVQTEEATEFIGCTDIETD